jgi:tetratricopeptide (TPR) repeat protein
MENTRLIPSKSLAQTRNALLSALVAIAFSALSPTCAVGQADATWDQYQKAGADAVYAARYGDAERLLKQAVAKGALFGDSDLRFAKSLGELGRLYTTRGRFGEAQALLEAELHVKEVALGKNNTALIPDMGSMIQFDLAYGSAADADPLAENVLALLQGKLNEYCTQAQGKVTLKPGQPLTAWAGTADTSMRDPLIEWAIAVDAIGDAYKAHRNYDMADRLYKAALDVKGTVLGKEHLSLANSYDSLGSLCMEKNDYPEAESYLKDSLDMTERIQPPENPQVFARLDKLAKCYIAQKKYDDAERLYVRAQDFWKDNPSKRGAEARAKIALGSLYYDEKKFDLAAPILQQALQYAEEYHGADSIALVPYLQKYADDLYYLGDKEETNQLKARASTIAGVGSTQ